MNTWELVEAKKLVLSEAPLPAPQAGKLRVRVTKVLLANQDAAIFNGDVRVKFPLIPGRYAVGFIADDADPAWPRGTRVVLHGFRPIPQEGTVKRDFSADDYDACGKTVDGFLTDFVNVSPDDMTALPASVSDERGLLLHYVATAKEITDHLGAKKGQHIVVVGADIIGILVCQLLIYQQAAPILVDADKGRLAFARNCGIYYTVPAYINLLTAVASVTGGRLASGAVYIASASGNRTEVPLLLCAHAGKVVYFGSSGSRVLIDLSVAFKKHLSLNCVSHGIKYLKTAINLMANKAVDPSPFHANACKPSKVADFLAGYDQKKDRDVDEISFVDLLQ